MDSMIVYDVTLREGMQSPGMSFTVADKLRIAKLLDNLGVDFIEGGSPYSNPKDEEFFEKIESLKLKRAKLCAFGATCKVDSSAEQDKGLISLASSRAEYVCIYGKASRFQVENILRTTPERNLEVITESVKFIKNSGKHVFFDAEHYFDGFKKDKTYALECIKAASSAGAEYIILCDTNGGILPHELSEAAAETVAALPNIKFGIHCHNDSGVADANTVEAARLGVSCVQVSLHGFGERCGNANLFTVIPDLQLKMGIKCLPSLANLSEAAYTSADILNIKNSPKSPYVGRDAFRHKAGAHIDAVIKDPLSFEHIEPGLVGNSRHFVVSEVSGKAAVSEKISSLIPGLTPSNEDAEKVCAELKKLELAGYQFENADASFEMMVRRTLGMYKPHFTLNNYKVIAFSGEIYGRETASAMVDMVVNGEAEITAEKGIGPVDALDGALRRALERFYPEISHMHLNDYRVHVLDTKEATASTVRVLIESTDGENVWNTVGVSGDIIEASWLALVDAHEYMLSRYGL
ncbi:MAG: citramalate synthase [Clostridia bacterium]|nr:citramalate synthase [Clostridia bacterium]